MLTKKEKILSQPFVIQNYRNHRRKVQSAKPVIDFDQPAEQPHVLLKLKKIQKERERMQEIERENQRLLQKLGQIMETNRLENYWRQPCPNFLNRVFIKTPKVKPVRAPSTSVNATIVAAAAQHEPNANGRKDFLKNRSSVRCPSCSGKPQTSAEHIPEDRVPWMLQRKSWNFKLLNETPKIHKCCKFCC